jgi:hypothetical protein
MKTDGLLIPTPSTYLLLVRMQITTAPYICTHRQGRRKSIKYQLDERKVPLIVFGDAMFGKDQVKLEAHRSCVVEKLFKSLRSKETESQLQLKNIKSQKNATFASTMI